MNPLPVVKSAAPGTLVPLSSGNPLSRGSAILIQALKGNAGDVYIGVAGLDRATAANQVAWLGAGGSVLLPSYSGAALNPETLFLDADNAGDGVTVTVLP